MSLIPAQSSDLSSGDSVGNYTLTDGSKNIIKSDDELEKIIEIINGSEKGSVFTIIVNDNDTNFSGFTLKNGNYVTLTSSPDEAFTLTKTSAGRHFTVASGATLTLENITLDGGKDKGNIGGGIEVEKGGTLVMNDGAAIQKCSVPGTNAYGGGVYNSGSFTMNNGVISGNAVGWISSGGGVYNEGTFTMNNGVISGNTASGGGGVYNKKGCAFTMMGGEISNNNGDGVSNSGTFTMMGGEISNNNGDGVSNSGTFTMNSGEISNNSDSGVSNSNTFTMNSGEISKNKDGGVFNYGTFTMKDGEIIGNTATEGGGGVFNYGTFTMKDGEISGNMADTSSGSVYNGGGVNNLHGKFTMEGGAIFGNTANNGGGVYVENGTFTMEGGAIFGNTANNGGGVYVENGTFTMGGEEISDNTANKSGGGVYNGGTFTMNGGEISGNTGRGVYNSFYGAFTMNGGEISGNKETTNGGGVYNGGNFTMNGGEISGNTATWSSGGGVYNYGTFTMNSGEISGNIAGYDGGGVYNIYSGNFTMNDGEISGNAASWGGGVSNNNGGNFTMNDGEISDNTASWGGGGVYSNCTFTMNDGEISGNTATNGGGVFNATYEAEFEMIAGEISGNIATENGGGILGVDSVTNIKDGKISGNTAELGGGLYVFLTSVVTITNGEISGNTAELGGGIYSTDSVINIKGGKISGNTATEADKNGSGGGIYTDNYASLTVGDGVIFSGNTAPTLRTKNIDDDAALTNYINKISKKVVLNAPTIQKLNAPAYNNYDINYPGDAYVVTIIIKPSGSGTVTATFEDKDTVSKNGYVYVPLTGDVITLSAIPKSGGKFIQFEIDEKEFGESSISFEVKENITVYATFLYREYSINVSADSGSEITPGGTVKVPYGFDEVFKFSARPGYKITAVFVNDVPISSAELASGEYTFRNVKSNHTIYVESEADDGSGGGSDIGAGGSGGSETGSGGNADSEWLIIGVVCVMLAVFSGAVILIVRRDRRRTDDS